MEAAMNGCLKAMRKNTIYVRRLVAKDGPHETLDVVIAMKAYVEVRDRVQGAPGGTELVEETFIVTEEEIYVDDRIWVNHPTVTTAPDTTVGGRKPRAVRPFMDPEKTATISHYETSL